MFIRRAAYSAYPISPFSSCEIVLGIASVDWETEVAGVTPFKISCIVRSLVRFYKIKFSVK